MKLEKITGIAAATLTLGIANSAPLKSAVVTTVVNDVRLSEKSAEAHAIGTGTKMTGSSTILTGRNSRAAMTFPDQTVTRIGANSVFSFSSGSRDMAIQQGSFLLQVPKNAGGATIRTATVTAGITGTTTMMEYNPGKFIKFVCLEGKAKLTNKNGGKVEVSAGQMLVMNPDAANFPRPVVVNIEKMMKTSALADEDTFGDLAVPAGQAIDETVARQKADRNRGNLIPAGLLPRGSDQLSGNVRSLSGEVFHSNNNPYSPDPNPYPNPNPNPNPNPYPGNTGP